jgi:protein O-GlcNAc transferase
MMSRDRAVQHLEVARQAIAERRFADAYDACEQAVRADPSFAEAHANLGSSARLLLREGEAIDHLRTALKLDPQHPSIWNLLATILKNCGELDDAIDAYAHAAALSPGDESFHSNQLYTILFRHAGDPEHVAAEHFAWGRRATASVRQYTHQESRGRSPAQRLRVGYVSPHFHNHAVNFFVEPILENHDHRAVEVFCFSDSDRRDATNARLRSYADVWRDVLAVPDERVAEQIHADRIDVLVDLAGHLGRNRLMVFARRPAPVQVTYIGYQATTGLPCMDWRVSDSHCDPPGMTERYHTERLLRVEPCFFVYRPSASSPDEGPLPALANGHVTFVCQNNFAKVSPQCIALWADVLRAVPKSKLAVLVPDAPEPREKLLRAFGDLDIATPRIQLLPRASRLDYLRRCNEIDIALDPTPFNGHTTTCDALWMGVPIVTLSGNAYVSRYGGSALRGVGLEEWIASSPEQYVQIARDWAAQLPALASLRASLRERLRTSPVTDGIGFARRWEAAMRSAWADRATR